MAQDARPTLMVVHAHPDDEAISTGGVLARYSAQGFRTVLVTCTDGSCGDGPGGVKPGEPGHDPAQVVTVRQRELEVSIAALGITDLELLGYADSGMMGWAQNEAAGAFWGTPVAEAAERLAELIEKYQPDVVVTYDENGFYGHPDHIQTHRVTMAAIQRTGSPAKVYWTTVPRSVLETQSVEFLKEMLANAADEEARARAHEDAAGFAKLGLPDDEITTWVDVHAWTDQKFDSLAAHASQSDNVYFLQLGREKFGQQLGVETFLRVDAGVTPGLREDDLFAGRSG